jgi:ppGpp synthetase/RelA/SpoT-type nucleotidyltranferase
VSDIKKISDFIKKEFIVLESEDKEESLKVDQFGYRSFHFVVKIKNDWLKAPIYRELVGMKAEIQVRTILMHAWAEIQHKLAYKREEHIPDQFKRNLHILTRIVQLKVRN